MSDKSPGKLPCISCGWHQTKSVHSMVLTSGVHSQKQAYTRLGVWGGGGGGGLKHMIQVLQVKLII